MNTWNHHEDQIAFCSHKLTLTQANPNPTWMFPNEMHILIMEDRSKTHLCLQLLPFHPAVQVVLDLHEDLGVHQSQLVPLPPCLLYYLRPRTIFNSAPRTQKLVNLFVLRYLIHQLSFFFHPTYWETIKLALNVFTCTLIKWLSDNRQFKWSLWIT